MPEQAADPLAAWAADEPGVVALSAASGTWTTAELDRDVDALVERWSAEGIRAGDRVATLLQDDAPSLLAVHAARRGGVVLAPLNRRATARELALQLSDIGAAALVHDGLAAAVAHEVALATGVGAWTFPSALDPPARPGASADRRAAEGVSAERRAAGPASAARGAAERSVGPQAGSPATIIFTSGTTGRPRGAVLTHANHAASADAWSAVLRPRPGDRWLACLPLHHVAGLAIVMRASRWRMRLDVLPRFDADALVDRIEAGISHLSLVPTQLLDLLAAWRERAVPASLRAVLLGGAPVPAPALARARALGLPVLTTYGMTETGSGVAVGGAEAATLEDPSALRPLPGVRMRIVDPDRDGVGAIEVRGGMVFAGYVGAGGSLVDGPVEGWLHTGDLGSLDAGGLLRVSDRRDDLIISGGENVFPAEVEAVLREHAAVLEAAVVPAPDARWGRVPVAAVVLAPGATVEDAELERHCRERLGRYKVPVRFHRVSELPRGESGKVLRRTLRARLGEPEP